MADITRFLIETAFTRIQQAVGARTGMIDKVDQRTVQLGELSRIKQLRSQISSRSPGLAYYGERVHRYIKAVGAGQKRARALTREEAREAMTILIEDRATPEQVGAFLLALRMKGETADELAGFVDALRTTFPAHENSERSWIDIDCHGDGHKGRASLLPAAACIVASLGHPVLLRADLGSSTARHGIASALEGLGLISHPARPALAKPPIAVIDLREYCPPLKRLVDLRPLFGVRTVAQTLMKLLDPLPSRLRLVGVFHAPYLESTARALAILSDMPAVCVQALGGLPEAAPGKITRIAQSNATETASLDLRFLPLSPNADGEDPAEINLAALRGESPAQERAIAAAAPLLHFAENISLKSAASRAEDAIGSGRALKLVRK